MPGRIAIWALLVAFATLPAWAEQKPRKQPRNTGGSEKLTYSWVDEHGNLQYGDRVPPEYAKRELRVLNNQGVEVKRIDAQKGDGREQINVRGLLSIEGNRVRVGDPAAQQWVFA